ncbi:MAG: sugar transferase [Clostridium sp.]|nr:sugar transferase [Clostridium sp.]
MISERRQRTIYVVADWLSTNFAWFLFNLSRYAMLDHGRVGWSLKSYLVSGTVIAGQILFPLVMLGVYWLSGYYNNVFNKSRTEELTSTFTSTLIGAILIFFMVLLNDMSDNLWQDYSLFGVMIGILFVCVYLIRWIITSHATRKIHAGQWGFDIFVIGTGLRTAEFIRDPKIARSMGFRIAGIVRRADETAPNNPVSAWKLPVIDEANLERELSERQIHSLVVIPEADESRDRILGLLCRLFPLERRIYMIPDQHDRLITRARTTNIFGSPLIDISRSDIPESTKNLKRIGDILVSAAAIVVLFPLMLAAAVAVKAGSPGPVLYRQRRIGYHKRPFEIIKFRTMTVDAETTGPALSMGDDDPRITRAGRFLRKYRIDELPQFLNVLKGEMSIVGPRPEREFYINRIMERAPYYAMLHRVRPGITSWGMVRYGYASDVDQMVERLHYDILYLENMSFSIDMKIILHTFCTVFKGRGK